MYICSIITRKKHLFFDIIRFSHLIISTNGLPQLLPELLFVLQCIQAHISEKINPSFNRPEKDTNSINDEY
jgi:hypothetical protein